MPTALAEGIVDFAKQTLMGSAGLVSALREIQMSPGEPRIVTVTSVTAALEYVSPIRIPGNQGAAGFTYEEAATGAIGETIERYCAANYEWEDLICASRDELGDAAAGMDRFALYTDELLNTPGTGLGKWDPAAPTYWREAKSLVDGGLRYLPAALLYTPYRGDDPRKLPLLALAVSSGQACHTDRTRALLSGLCEAVERDAFMITWMRRIPPTRIDFRKDSYLDAMYRRYFQCESTQFDVFDISLDIRIPTVLCVTSGTTSRGKFLNVGCAAHPSERQAVIKAMKEACQGASWARSLMESKPAWRPAPGYVNLLEFEDHVRLYCEPEMEPAMDFIMKTPKHREVAPDCAAPGGAEEELRRCVNEMARCGLEAVAVDLTTPEMAELGFYVPKVMAAGLVHLTAVHLLPALATPRYTEVPRRLGLTDPIHFEFNPTPHPFP